MPDVLVDETSALSAALATDAVQIIQFARSKLQQACDSLRDGLQNEVKQTALQIIKAVLQGDSAALQNLSPAAPIPVAPAPKGVLQQQQGTQSRSDRRATGAQQQPKSIRVNSRTSAKMLLDYERCMDCMVLEVSQHVAWWAALPQRISLVFQLSLACIDSKQ